MKTNFVSNGVSISKLLPAKRKKLRIQAKNMFVEKADSSRFEKQGFAPF